MVINHERRWVYLAPPKTGSMSLHLLLTAPPFDGGRIGSVGDEQHRTDIPPECSGYLTFASVRNPFARATSIYRHMARAHPDRPGAGSFGEFAEVVLLGRLYGPFYSATICEWLGGARVDRLIRLESLAADLDNLGLTGQPYEVPHVNAAWGDWPWQAYYDRAAADCVRAWAEADFERFGYPIDLDPPSEVPRPGKRAGRARTPGCS